MKKFISLFMVVIGSTFLALPAHALLIGSFSQTELNNIIDGKDATVDLFNLTGTKATSLNKSVLENGNVYKIGNAFYFTNSHGLQSSVATSKTSNTLKSGAKLSLGAKQGSLLVVSDDRSNGQSFFYDTSKKTVILPSNKINTISSSSISADGKVVALLGKNSKGKLKLFISPGPSKTVSEFALPTYATNCGTLALAPDGKQLFVGCRFNIPKQTTGQLGYVIVPIKAGIIGKQQRTISGTEISTSVWLSTTKLISIESDSANSTTITEHILSDGKQVDTAVVGKDESLTLNGYPAIGTPIEILPGSTKDSVYYTYIVYTSTNPVVYATFIGKYNTVKSKDTILLNDGGFFQMVESR